MGESRRRRESCGTGREAVAACRVVEIEDMEPHPATGFERLAQLAPHLSAPVGGHLLLNAYRARVDDREFRVGFTVGDQNTMTAIGHLVVERMMLDCAGARLPVRINLFRSHIGTCWYGPFPTALRSHASG